GDGDFQLGNAVLDLHGGGVEQHGQAFALVAVEVDIAVGDHGLVVFRLGHGGLAGHSLDFKLRVVIGSEGIIVSIDHDVLKLPIGAGDGEVGSGTLAVGGHSGVAVEHLEVQGFNNVPTILGSLAEAGEGDVVVLGRDLDAEAVVMVLGGNHYGGDIG